MTTDDDNPFAVALVAYFAHLEVLDFSRAALAATRLPCARSLARALADLATCESLYFSMAHLTSLAALERRLDATARELEVCLSLPAPLVMPSATSWSKKWWTSAPGPSRGVSLTGEPAESPTTEVRVPLDAASAPGCIDVARAALRLACSTGNVNVAQATLKSLAPTRKKSNKQT